MTILELIENYALLRLEGWEDTVGGCEAEVWAILLHVLAKNKSNSNTCSLLLNFWQTSSMQSEMDE